MANLGHELADQSETLRSRIAEVFAQWRKRYAACFKQAQEAGEIPKHLNVEVRAEFYLSAWEGAVLQVKVMRNVEPFKRFIQVMFEEVLKQ
jgi:TetR/AcrR family transcriptional repressor of nem operon